MTRRFTWADLWILFVVGFLYGLLSAVIWFKYFAHPWQVPGANG